MLTIMLENCYKPFAPQLLSKRYVLTLRHTSPNIPFIILTHMMTIFNDFERQNACFDELLMYFFLKLRVLLVHDNLIVLVHNPYVGVLFLCMVMSSIPLLVLYPILNPIQPLFCGFIHFRLVNALEEYLNRFILYRYRVRQDNINFPTKLIELFLHTSFYFIRWLFIRPPALSRSP